MTALHGEVAAHTNSETHARGWVRAKVRVRVRVRPMVGVGLERKKQLVHWALLKRSEQRTLNVCLLLLRR